MVTGRNWLCMVRISLPDLLQDVDLQVGGFPVFLQVLDDLQSDWSPSAVSQDNVLQWKTPPTLENITLPAAVQTLHHLPKGSLPQRVHDLVWKADYHCQVAATLRRPNRVIKLGRTSVLEDITALVDQVAVLRVSLSVSWSFVAAPLNTPTRLQQVEKKSRGEPGAPDIKGKGQQPEPSPLPPPPTVIDNLFEQTPIGGDWFTRQANAIWRHQNVQFFVALQLSSTQRPLMVERGIQSHILNL